MYDFVKVFMSYQRLDFGSLCSLDKRKFVRRIIGQAARDFVAGLVDNADRAACVEAALHSDDSCRQNAAAAAFTHCFGAAVIYDEPA